MGDLDEVIGELDHVLEAGTDGGQCVLEVDEGLFRLGTKIAGRADDLVVEVEAELAGNEDIRPGAAGSTTWVYPMGLAMVSGLRNLCFAMASSLARTPVLVAAGG